MADRKTDRKRPPRARWKELGRKELGIYASGPVSGPGWSNPGYYHLVYEVSERNYAAGPKDHPADQYRTRVEIGPACRLYGEGYAAFHTLYQIYAAHARAHAERHKESIAGDCYDVRFRYVSEDTHAKRTKSPKRA